MPRLGGGHGGLQASSGPGRGVARPLPPPTAQQHCEGHVDAAALPLIAAKEKSMVGAGIFQPDAACWRLGTAWARCQAHWTEQRAHHASCAASHRRLGEESDMSGNVELQHRHLHSNIGEAFPAALPCVGRPEEQLTEEQQWWASRMRCITFGAQCATVGGGRPNSLVVRAAGGKQRGGGSGGKQRRGGKQLQQEQQSNKPPTARSKTLLMTEFKADEIIMFDPVPAPVDGSVPAQLSGDGCQ